MQLNNPHLQKYHDHGFYLIRGFTYPQCFKVIDFFDSTDLNTSGGIMEIGVEHGQFYMLLNCTTSSEEKSYCVDVFDQQNLNIDRSGKGSEFHFLTNLKNLDKHTTANTNIIKGDSTDKELKIVDQIGPGSMRYISIDGGHTVTHTINDLMLAEQLIKNSGIVALDDISNYSWPGVVEGAVKYLLRDPTLVPVAIGYNKLWLCKLSYHQTYLDLLVNSSLIDNTTANPISKFMGWNLVILTPH